MDKLCEDGAGALGVGVGGLGTGYSFCSVAFFFPLPWKKVFIYYFFKTCCSDALLVNLNASVAGSCPPADDLCPPDATGTVKLARRRSPFLAGR